LHNLKNMCNHEYAICVVITGRRMGLSNHRGTFEAADFFVLRLPSTPFDALAAWRSAYDAGGGLTSTAQAADPLFREALFLASNNLYRKVAGPASGKTGEDDESLSIALARYAYRMSRRCTPFGAFAGVGVGAIADGESRLAAPEVSEWRRIARIDQAIVAKMHDDLLTQPGSGDLIRRLEVELNTSLWKAYDGYRYVEAVRGGAWTHYELSRIAETPAVTAVHDLLREGPRKVSELAEALAGTLGSDPESAAAFIERLVREQLLEYRPRMSVTGDDVVSSFVRDLSELADGQSSIEAVQGANAALLETEGSERPIDRYQAAMARLWEAYPKADPSKAIQVDLQIPGQGLTLSRPFVDGILRTLERLSPLLSRAHEELSGFAVEFERRYGDSAIPLLEVLDGDLGMGFGDATKLRTPLLNGIPLGGPRPNRRVEFRDADAFFLGRTQQAVAAGDAWIDLSDEELDKFRDTSAPLPSTTSLLGVVESDETGPCGFSFLGAFGPPAAILLGRFACGSPELTDKLRGFIETSETRSDAIVAEFAHLPDGRVGNVILRPVLRRYEIPYLGSSGADPDAVISPKDLDVFCRHGVVRLWSRTHGREVLPRISNAHNNNNALNVPLYRFIGALQRQNEPLFGWQWGAILDSLPFLPGVRHRNVTVVRPRWRLYPYETKELKDGGETALDALLDKRSMPRRLRVRQADNFLELDLSHRLDRRLFLDEAHRNRTLECEAWTEPDGHAASIGGRPHANEVIIPVRSAAPAHTTARPVAAEDRASHPPGSEWLYASIYCGPSVADRWLASGFPAWAERALAAGCAIPFFIRYHDNGPHIRVRVSGPPERVWGDVRAGLEESIQPLLDSRAVTRLQYGTYFPEFVRYGGPATLAACETIFSADSLAASRVLAALPAGGERESARWQGGFRSLFHMVRAFGMDHVAELALLARFRDGYAQEFSVGAAGRTALNATYRTHRGYFDATVQESVSDLDPVFGERTAGIRRAVASGVLAISPSTGVADSLLHMAANRLFPERARAHELTIFHAMHKAIESAHARTRYAKSDRRPLPEAGAGESREVV